MKGYIIATKIDECYGHGDYGTEYAMKQENAYHNEGIFPPVFLKKESAEEYLSKSKWKYNRLVFEVNIEEL